MNRIVAMITDALPVSVASTSPPTSEKTLPLLGLIDRLAAECGVPLDRARVRTVLGESAHHPVADPTATVGRAISQLGMVERTLRLTVDAALRACQNGSVLAIAAKPAPGPARWVLLCDATATRAKVACEQGTDSWIPVAELLRLIDASTPDAVMNWITVEPALPCSDASVHATGAGSATSESARHQHHPHPSPLTRLLAILQPESGDIWVVTIFAIVVSLLALATPITVEALVNTVAFGRFMQPVVILSLILLGFLSFAAAIRVLQTYVAEIIQRRIFVRVVADLSQRLPRVRQEALDESHGPELLNRFFDVMTVQKSAALLVLDGIAIVLQTGVGMAVLAFYHPLLAGLDVLLVLCMLFMVFALGHGAVRTSIAESRAKYAVAAWLEQLALCPNSFKSGGGGAWAVERADRLAIDYLQARQQHFRVLLRQVVFTVGLQALTGSVLLGVGGWLVIQGQLTLGQLVAAELIVAVITGSFAKLGKHLESFYDLLAAVEKLGHLFDLPVEPRRSESLRSGAQGIAIRIESLPLDARLSAQFSATIAAGQMAALVGPPGSGKYRLADILYGLRIPASGAIEFDGTDIRSLDPQSLRTVVALARGQEMITGSITENVHWNRPGVSLADVRAVLQLLGIYRELQALPEGLETIVQPDGAPLTECQVRRIVLARALVGRPRLLIVGELLDGLPDSVLADVLEVLRTYSATTTIVVATGRSDVAQACEIVIPVAPGRSQQTPALSRSGVPGPVSPTLTA